MTESLPVSPFGWDWINDLCAIAQDKILDFLLHRVERGQIYTWVGPLLLSVNPGNETLVNLFDEGHQIKYSENLEIVSKNAEPHVYAIASRARYRLVQGLGKISQVIVISGESGTGKTFNARKIIDFLATIDKNSARCCFPDGISDIAHEIGNVWPLITAFSTARTEKNSQSSRHGQLVRLQYYDGAIRGACVHSFLLERTRVTRESDTFDIFYQALAGLPDAELRKLNLSWGGEYTILGEDYSVRKEYYGEQFRDTVKVLKTLGFSDECRKEIFQVLGLLIHMGNIKFIANDQESCTIDFEDKESSKAFENARLLTYLSEDELINLLTSTLICPPSTKRRYTMYRRSLKTLEDCRYRLSSIIRCLYDRLFHWLVDQVNDILSVKNDEDYNWLGILDIFGFESFAENGLEQLCINYSTERLQLYFMEKYLEDGQRELEEEGLDILPIPPTINVYRARMNTIEGNLFATINDACQSPIAPTISAVFREMTTKEMKPFLRIKNETFIINHYSCSVEYSIQDILEKNTDKIPTELSNAFYSCQNKLLHSLSNIPESNANENGRVSLKKCTTLLKLKDNLDALMKELNKCDAHYVRCVRPTRIKDVWLKFDFSHQLASSGILDALPLAKCRFPIRLTCEEFSKRYSVHEEEDSDIKLQCLLALRDINSSEDLSSSVHVGPRLIFLTKALFFELELFRKKNRSNAQPAEVQLIPESIKTISLPNVKASPSKSSDDNVFLSAPGQQHRIAGSIERKEAMKTNINNNIVNEPCSAPKILLNDEMMSDENEWQLKELYIAEWIKNASSSNVSSDVDADPSESQIQKMGNKLFLTGNNGGKFRKLNHGNFQSTFGDVEWSQDGTSCIVLVNNCRLFYRNRILSRRRLAGVPIRFHTRSTCLKDSHCLPRSELPNGLQDCL